MFSRTASKKKSFSDQSSLAANSVPYDERQARSPPLPVGPLPAASPSPFSSFADYSINQSSINRVRVPQDGHPDISVPLNLLPVTRTDADSISYMNGRRGSRDTTHSRTSTDEMPPPTSPSAIRTIRSVKSNADRPERREVMSEGPLLGTAAQSQSISSQRQMQQPRPKDAPRSSAPSDFGAISYYGSAGSLSSTASSSRNSSRMNGGTASSRTTNLSYNEQSDLSHRSSIRSVRSSASLKQPSTPQPPLPPTPTQPQRRPVDMPPPSPQLGHQSKHSRSSITSAIFSTHRGSGEPADARPARPPTPEVERAFRRLMKKRDLQDDAMLTMSIDKKWQLVCAEPKERPMEVGKFFEPFMNGTVSVQNVRGLSVALRTNDTA